MASDEDVLPFQYDIPSSSLHFINRENLTALEKHLYPLSKIDFITIDTESKPSGVNWRKNCSPVKVREYCEFAGNNNSSNEATKQYNVVDNVHKPVVLMQMGIRDKSGNEVVILIDLLDLSYDFANATNSKESTLGFLNNIFSDLLQEKEIIKFGQGLIHDMNEINRTYPSLTAFQLVNSVLDTNTLHQFIHTEIKQCISLSNLTLHYLHMHLMKTEQCSNWHIRPLTASQTNYAACDALVLLRLYDIMSCEAAEKASDNDSKTKFDVINLTIDYKYDRVYVTNSASKKRKINDKRNISQSEDNTPITTTTTKSLFYNISKWQSLSQRQWLLQQLELLPPDRDTATSLESDDDDGNTISIVPIVLPKEKLGKHIYFS
jgi:hypothetical protein